MQWEFPSKHAYVATVDGGYVSSSNLEDEDIVVAKITRVDDEHETSDEEVLGIHTTENYHALSAQVDHGTKVQCHKLFQTFFIFNNCQW